MKINRFNIIAVVLGVLLVVNLNHVAIAGWNGAGVINTLYVYPTYVVAIQGPSTGGPAGCTENAAWSFRWNDFSPEVQARIMSVLLAAKTSGTSIQIVVDESVCGPEGKKKFNGMIQVR
jgi:hypothetical protein